MNKSCRKPIILSLLLVAFLLPVSGFGKLPHWRGFNLLNKFYLGGKHDGPFLEEDFRLIHELGFNFVRLPMDYRIWIKDGDWRSFDEAAFKEIDQAVEWGGKYGIHVCINFHRAPGYTVAKPPEKTSLWTDAETQEVCALHWAFFARRYKDIPSDRLSFNLLNEPTGADSTQYAAVAKKLIRAIRAEDPDRLIISDGIGWARKPCMELLPLNIVQATRGYQPMGVSHYQASWVTGGKDLPEPTWPMTPVNGLLCGPAKKGLHGPLVFEGDFGTAFELRLRVGTVSNKARLIVRADGKEIYQREFRCGPGEGEWKEAVYQPQWKIYQNRYDRDYRCAVPDGVQRLEIQVTDGDWLSLKEIGFNSGGREHIQALEINWKQAPQPVKVFPTSGKWRFETGTMRDRTWLWQECIVPWLEFERQGGEVLVGEWGAYNHTPHDVALAWMEDCLKNWQKAGWGWALWNFRGSFGIIDSDRADVDYEDWNGLKLDRKMLDLLQRY